MRGFRFSAPTFRTAARFGCGAMEEDNTYLPLMRTVGFVASVALLLFLGGSSIQSFLGDLSLPETLWQRIANLGQLLCAVAGLSAGVGALLKRRWAGRVALVFAGAVSFTAWIGSVAWEDAGIFRSLLDAGLGFLLGYVLYLGVRGDRAGPGVGGVLSLPRGLGGRTRRGESDSPGS